MPNKLTRKIDYTLIRQIFEILLYVTALIFIIIICLIIYFIVKFTKRISKKEQFYNYGAYGIENDRNSLQELTMQNKDLEFMVVSALYNIPGKHSPESYKKYVSNWLPYYKNGYLVMFCDDYYYDFVKKMRVDAGLMDRTIIIYLPLEELKNYKLYENKWKANFERMQKIGGNVSFEYKKQIIWSEKINFMYEAYLLVPNAKWICWLDAGYFRDAENDTNIAAMLPLKEKLDVIDKSKIYLIRLYTDDWYDAFYKVVNDKENGSMLSKENVDYNSALIAAGGILVHYTKLYDIWYSFYHTLQQFMIVDRNILEEQMILAHTAFYAKYANDYVMLKSPPEYKKDGWFYMKDYLTTP